jgi:hypothetical protein
MVEKGEGQPTLMLYHTTPMCPGRQARTDNLVPNILLLVVHVIGKTVYMFDPVEIWMNRYITYCFMTTKVLVDE